MVFAIFEGDFRVLIHYPFQFFRDQICHFSKFGCKVSFIGLCVAYFSKVSSIFRAPNVKVLFQGFLCYSVCANKGQVLAFTVLLGTADIILDNFDAVLSFTLQFRPGSVDIKRLELASSLARCS